MFFHNFKYNFKILVHNKSMMLWSVAFVIILGTLFYVSFGNIYEQELIKSIKVAAVIDDAEVAQSFDDMIAGISLDEENGERLLDISDVTDMDEAKALLADGEIEGIFYSENGELKLIVYENGLAQSILASVVGKYHQITTIIADMSVNAPDKIPMALAELLLGETRNIEKKTTDGSMDVYISYFYNLIAMACLLAIDSGIHVTVNTQANLSTVGARKCVSGANSVSCTVSGLLASVVVQCLCSLVGLLYLVMLGVDFGNRTAYIALAIICGCFAGVSMGFFIGSIGRFSANTKNSIGTAFMLVCCFLSGLMVGNMRMIVEELCPVINKINPAVLISDSFYALNIYDTHDRYFNNLITLLIMSVVFITAGALLGRRKKYASI